jgi:ElaB/YqjD/DUF883 family membrane-anchored ribosome-binding protein
MKNRIIELFSNGNGRTTTEEESPQIEWKSMQTKIADVSSYVAENPGVCLGAAFAAGILLGWMVKRT